MPFGGDGDRYPHRDEVVAYLASYAARLDAEIRNRTRVVEVRPGGKGFAVALEGGQQLAARAVVAASGTFGRPCRPDLPGLAHFAGSVLHAADYRTPEPFAGQQVIVAGAGNSAVQIAAELATAARVTLAGRTPARFARQHILGRDLHFWLARTGIDTAPVGRFLRTPPTQLVIDDSRYRAATGRRHSGPPRGLHRRRRRQGSPGRTGRSKRSTRFCWPPATGLTCPTSTGLALWTGRGIRCTATAPPSPIQGWSMWGRNGSAACRRTPCAGSAGTPSAPPAAWPLTSRGHDAVRPHRSGSTCVNIDACRMRRCCRCWSRRARRRAARR